MSTVLLAFLARVVAGVDKFSLQVKAFGINRMDIAQREGRYQPPAGCTPVLGVEFAGHIAELGPDVSDGWCEGDETMGLAGGVMSFHLCSRTSIY